MMSGKQTRKLHNEMAITSRRQIVSEMYLRGVRQSDIAERFGVTQQCISLDIRALLDEWREYALININDLIQVEIEKINYLENTYWEAWEKSRGTKYTLTAKTKSKGRRSDENTKSKREEEMLGDPRFLAGVQWCIDRRIKLLGLDPPESVNVTTIGTAPVEVVGFDTDKV